MHDVEVNNPPGQPTRNNHRPPQPASSDPRLNRPRPPVSTSSLSQLQTSNLSSPITRPTPTQTPTSQTPQRQIQQLSTIAPQAQPESIQKQDGFDMNGLVPKLLELVDSRVSRMLQLQQKQAFEKDEAYNRRDLEKAKQANAFPATIESLQAESAATQSKMSKINHELTRQQERSSELAEDLGNLLRQMMQTMQKFNVPAKPPSADFANVSGVVQNVTSLEDDVSKIKRTILIKEEKELPQRPIDLAKICNTVESQSRAHTGFRKSLNAFEEWQSATDKQLVETKARLKCNPPSTGFPELEAADRNTTRTLEVQENRLKTIEQTTSTLNGRLDEISTRQGEFEKNSLIERSLQNDIAKQGEGNSVAINEMKQKLDGLSRHPDFLGHGHQTPNRAHGLSPELEERMTHFEKDLVKMKEHWEDLLRRVPHLSEASNEIQKHVKSYDGLVTGLRSLEFRYNNIHTDSLVQQMSHAISEMYPSTHQLTEEVKSLRKAVGDHSRDIVATKTDVQANSKNITHLETRLGNLGQALDIQKAENINKTSALDRKVETSNAHFSNLETQFRDLVLHEENLKKTVDNMLIEHTSKEISLPASSETPTGPQAKAIHDKMKEMHDDMAALLETGKRDMLNILAELNGIFTSQSNASAMAGSSEGAQDPAQQLEPESISELGPRSTGSISTRQTAPDHSNTDILPSLDSTSQQANNHATSSALMTGVPHNAHVADNSMSSQVSLKPTAVSNNKRPRDTLSDNDSTSSAAATTATPSQSPAASLNPDERLSKKAKKRLKRQRQSNLGGNGQI
ncbi:hypothetical protein PENSTE_c003G07668 [Penicillium steckii]|uniref:Uncharacterized protein n=1 Tax=Penicillium steckii TaxID=303698 RepID=A0A1V6TQH0_9EURO|nr:hypothetical protein PENSTE_c003G07668 [Penicillium steckii]